MMNFDKMLSRIYKIVKILFFAFLIMSFLKINVDAKEQTRSMNNMIYTFSCGDNNTSYNKWCAYTQGQINAYTKKNINTTYNGVINGIQFSWQETMSSQVTVTINAMSTDFRNKDFYCSVYGSNSENSLGSVISGASCSYVSKSKIVAVIPANTYTYHTIDIEGYPLTGVSTYGIKSIVESWDDGSVDMSGVIDSQNQNTQDIIDNNNNNTQDVIDNQNQNTQSMLDKLLENSMQEINNTHQQLGRMCKNVYTPVIYFGHAISESDGVTLTNNLGYYTDYFAVNNINIDGESATNKVYIKEPGDSTRGYSFFWYDSNKNLIDWTRTSTRVVTLPSNAVYLRYASTSPNTTISRYSVECIESGDLVNDYLRDDSNPTINDSDLQNTMNSVNVSNPLEYFLTLPTTLLSKIQDGLDANSCTAVQLGHFGQLGRHDLSGYTFTLPCINFEQKLGSTLWNTIDLFVAIGILALTIYKLYESISNILTLGAEDEVKAHLSFLSPMEFLASIIGNGGFSTFTSQVYRGGR